MTRMGSTEDMNGSDCAICGSNDSRSLVVVIYFLHCLKVGANADGSDILVMNPFKYILREVNQHHQL